MAGSPLGTLLSRFLPSELGQGVVFVAGSSAGPDLVCGWRGGSREVPSACGSIKDEC